MFILTLMQLSLGTVIRLKNVIIITDELLNDKIVLDSRVCLCPRYLSDDERPNRIKPPQRREHIRKVIIILLKFYPVVYFTYVYRDFTSTAILFS